jgi:hypothetical protein
VTASDPVAKLKDAEALSASDPLKERFRNDDEANALLARPQRWPYALG